MREELAGWLAQMVGVDTVDVGDFTTPEGVGHSNETVLVDMTYVDAAGAKHEEPLVVRLETQGGVFPAYDLGLQVGCIRQVAAVSSVPVPNVRGIELDPAVLGRSFFVMDRIDGLVAADRMPYTIFGWLNEATPEQQTELYWSSLETMSELHKLDWQQAGFGILDRSEYGPAGLDQQLAWWQDYVAWEAEGRVQPTIDAAGEWIVAHQPASPPTGLNWGDARISNMMYRDFRPVAVLDWEMATLGPAEVDLAWFLFFQRFFSEGIGVPDLPGFPTRDETIARYSELLGRPIEDLFWYEVFGAWRFAAIMARIADLSEAAGDFPPGSDARDNNLAVRMLAAMLDLPSPGEPGGPMG